MAEKTTTRTFKYSMLQEEISCDVEVSELARIIRETPRCYLIAVAGIPGAGKTELAQLLNAALENSVVIPMDGYHIERKNLSEEDLKVRGAPHTFDSAAFRRDLLALKDSKQGAFPSFDHAVKDPVKDDIAVTLNHKYVIVEGLYLFFEEWKVRDIFDFQIFLECSVDTAVERVAQRHLRAGVEPSIESARELAERNERQNARLVLDKSILGERVFRVRTDAG